MRTLISDATVVQVFSSMASVILFAFTVGCASPQKNAPAVTETHTTNLEKAQKQEYSMAGDSTHLAKSEIPQNFTASVTGDHSSTLKWDLVAGATSYKIYRRDDIQPLSSSVLIGTSRTNTFTDKAGGDGFIYKVAAVIGGVEKQATGEYGSIVDPDPNYRE